MLQVQICKKKRTEYKIKKIQKERKRERKSEKERKKRRKEGKKGERERTYFLNYFSVFLNTCKIYMSAVYSVNT